MQYMQYIIETVIQYFGKSFIVHVHVRKEKIFLIIMLD